MWKRLLACIYVLAYAFTHFHICKHLGCSSTQFRCASGDVSLPLHDVVGSGHALMEAMKGTVVSASVVIVQLSSQLTMYSSLINFVPLPEL